MKVYNCIEVLKSFVGCVLESMGHSLVAGDEKVPQMVGVDAQLGKPFQLMLSASVLTNINTLAFSKSPWVKKWIFFNHVIDQQPTLLTPIPLECGFILWMGLINEKYQISSFLFPKVKFIQGNNLVINFTVKIYISINQTLIRWFQKPRTKNTKSLVFPWIFFKIQTPVKTKTHEFWLNQSLLNKSKVFYKIGLVNSKAISRNQSFLSTKLKEIRGRSRTQPKSKKKVQSSEET